MRAMLGTIGAAAMLAACTTVDTAGPVASSDAPIAIEREAIRYETQPCFGFCPVYVVTVNANGTGTFEGKHHTAVTGTRAFKATPDAYRRFAAALQPYRPESGERLYQPGTPLCPEAATDMSSVDVLWTELSGASQHLNFYFGCGRDNDAMREALRSAPDVLPIAEFIGKRPS
jgi:hypothetical protein